MNHYIDEIRKMDSRFDDDEGLNAPVEVIVHYKGGKLFPLRFLYQGNVYKITRIYSAWRESHEQTSFYHVTAVTQTDTSVELVYNTASFGWRLKRMTPII